MLTRPSSIAPMKYLKPSPTPASPPSTLDAGVRNPSKTSSVDSTPLYPSFLSGGGIVRPGCSATPGSFSSTNAVMPRCARIGVGIGLREQHDEAGAQTVRRPHLLAGDHVVVAVANGRGADRLHVRARMRLGHRVGRADLARRHARAGSAARWSSVPYVLDHPRGEEVRVEHARQRHPATRELDLDQHVRRQIEPETAVLLRDVTPKSPSSFICSTSVSGKSSACSSSEATGSPRASTHSRIAETISAPARSSDRAHQRPLALRASSAKTLRPTVSCSSRREHGDSSSASACVGGQREQRRSRGTSRGPRPRSSGSPARPLVREVRLERPAVARADADAARETPPGTSGSPSSRSGRASRPARGRPGRRAPPRCTSASRRAPWTSIAAVEYWRLNFALVLRARRVLGGRPARARARRRASGIVTTTSSISSGETRRAALAVAPSEPCMKWQAGYGLNAIRSVSQRAPRSASWRVDVDSPSPRRGRRRRAPKRPSSTLGGPVGAVGGEPRRQHPAVGGPRRVDRLRRRAVLEEREEPAGEAPGDPERAASSFARRAREPRAAAAARRRRRRRGRVEAARVEGAGRRHADPRHDLVAGDDRGQHVASVGAVAPRRPRARRGHDDRGHVADGVGVRVVEVEAVAEHRVGEGRARRRQPAPSPITDACGPPPSSVIAVAALGRDVERVRREPAAERVEQVELRRLDHVGRDVVVARATSRSPRCARLRCVMAARPTVQSVSVPGNVLAASGASRR